MPFERIGSFIYLILQEVSFEHRGISIIDANIPAESVLSSGASINLELLARWRQIKSRVVARKFRHSSPRAEVEISNLSYKLSRLVSFRVAAVRIPKCPIDWSRSVGEACKRTKREEDQSVLRVTFTHLPRRHLSPSRRSPFKFY